MTEENSAPPVLYIIVPCYQEEDALPVTAARLQEKLSALTAQGMASEESRIVFVDDGSQDRTWDIIAALHEENAVFRGIRLSRNCGHQQALLAGLLTVREECSCTVTIDADLQDDVNAIDEMLRQYAAGCEIVCGVRADRETDTAFKRGTAQAYYKIMNAMGAGLVDNHADFRLMGQRAMAALAEYGEVNVFLRGMVPLLGFRTGEVRYTRAPRMQGRSKYPLGRMLAFAFEGVTSLSVRPIRLITFLGIGIFLVSLAMLIYILVRHFLGYTVTGWTFLAVSVWGIGGLHLLGIGIVGEYVGKIYLETKRRPRYHIESYLK